MYSKQGKKYKTKNKHRHFKTSPQRADFLANVFETINYNFIFHYFKENLVKTFSGEEVYIVSHL